MTENDYELGLYNGDTGVIVSGSAERLERGVRARGELLELQPAPARRRRHRVRDDDPQEPGLAVRHGGGSAAPPSSPILTRELLYTAVTRAREQLILVGTEDTMVTAVQRPVARASGLRRRLWGDQ